MMTTPSDLRTEISALPPNLRAEVLDFVQFVMQRHGLPSAPTTMPVTPDIGDSVLFQALEAMGFFGAIETDEQLAGSYKKRLDFPIRSGTRP